MYFDEDGEEKFFWYVCPCGDQFQITLEQLWRLRNEPIEQIFAEEEDVENFAEDEVQVLLDCPSCSLQLRVRYTKMELEELVE